MSNWNTADKVLLCTAFAFLAAVGFRMIFPDNIFVEGFLFVAEAAMVGGIADWFAVTALFRKPLGFPYHTAILPSRREEFIEASVTMVQQEFFSRRAIFKKLSNLQLMPQLIEQLERIETRKFVLTLIIEQIKTFVANLNKERIARQIANEIRRALRNVEPQLLVLELGRWLKQSGKDRELFVHLVKRVREKAQTLETRQLIRETLEQYANEKTKSSGSGSMLLSGLAQMLDIVNFVEAAGLTQVQLIKFIDELSTDSPLQRSVLNECRSTVGKITDSNDFKAFIDNLQLDTINALPIEAVIVKMISGIERQLNSMRVDKLVNAVCADLDRLPVVATDKPAIVKERTIGSLLAEVLCDEYTHALNILKNEGAVRSTVEKFIYDLIARTALHAQPLVGTIAQNVLQSLTDEQLNKLVYDKAEPDFIWIRLNGSIVGSIVGLAIFVVLQLVG
ncbi:MAG: DUF445 domain-containing protein [Selenomonadaceae bacterium]|nr:DUF445 domain-containing protein [Selenomonadaceae bacterium]